MMNLMSGLSGSSRRQDDKSLVRALEEKKQRRQDRLRRSIQEAARARTVTAEAVIAYAELLLADDHGRPITPAPHHQLWVRLLCDEHIKKLLIIAPPGSAKTTWAISAYIGCRIGIFPEQSVVIGSASGAIAEKRSLSLRTMTETAEWQATFPGVARAGGMKWDPVEWSLAPNGKPRAGRLHPTVAASGTGGPVIGSRADVVVADDLLDFENSRTARQRGLVEQWLHNSLLSRLKSRTGRAVVIGTAWHHDDIYAKARKEGGWVVCHVPLLSDGERVYATISYPDNWPYERLGEPIADAQAIATQ